MIRVKSLGIKPIEMEHYSSGDWEKIENENWEKLTKVDKEAREKGEIVGRYLRESIADGYALYLVIEESGDEVLIEHIKGISDDYMIPYFGEGRWIDRDYAEQNINWRDKWNELVKEKKMEGKE